MYFLVTLMRLAVYVMILVFAWKLYTRRRITQSKRAKQLKQVKQITERGDEK